jgi:hypothetical protein
MISSTRRFGEEIKNKKNRRMKSSQRSYSQELQKYETMMNLQENKKLSESRKIGNLQTKRNIILPQSNLKYYSKPSSLETPSKCKC